MFNLFFAVVMIGFIKDSDYNVLKSKKEIFFLLLFLRVCNLYNVYMQNICLYTSKGHYSILVNQRYNTQH